MGHDVFGSLTVSVLRIPYRFLQRLTFEILAAAKLRSAKTRLLHSGAHSRQEKLFAEISCRVHPNDFLYAIASPEEYLTAGVSALHCIDHILAQSAKHNVRTILDFACGYGRVSRFLKSRFPGAEITVSDIDSAAVNFCSRTFAARPVISNLALTDLNLGNKFDLIWCGSLITHIDEPAATRLLKLFHDHLSPGGVCIFTTHGNEAKKFMEKYGLTESAQRQVLSQFDECGYGYANYPGRDDMGVSLVSQQRMTAIASGAGRWNQTAFIDHGWHNRQDVYAFRVL